jgi:hypothetical protein
MKYSAKYPNLKVGDPPFLGIVRTPEFRPCCVCREQNDFACVYFECSVCSEECEQKIADASYKALVRIYKLINEPIEKRNL